MGACSRCVHFRKVKPPSQLLTGAIGSTNAAEVSSALAKIVEDEQKVRDGELDLKSKEGALDRDIWVMRPTMTEYCGLKEADDTFLICEVKNRGQQCGDFAAAKDHPPVRHACAECAHCITGSGTLRDEAVIRQYTQMANAAVAVQASPQIAQGLIKGHRDGSAARKALELSGAYAAKGVVMTRPEYLDHCGHLSTDDEFVICALQNPHQTCAVWTPRQPAARALTR